MLAEEIYDAENLAFDTHGRLFVTGGDGLHLITFDAQNAVARVQRDIIDVEGSFGGVAIGPDGCLYTVCYHHRTTRVLRIDIETAGFPWSVYLEGTIKAPNGLRFDDDGTLYAADFGFYLPGKGALWRIERSEETPEAAAGVTAVVEGMSGINGIAIDRERGRLYFSRTLAGKVHYLERGEGGLYEGDPSLLIDFDLPGPRFPIVDDMALDADGNLLVCLYNADEIRMVRPDGTWIATLIPGELKRPTAVAFGIRPDDRRTLYVTQKGRIMVHDRRGGDRVSRSFGVADPYLLPFVATDADQGGSN